MSSAPVNRILPTSFVDGPGNRTAIFLQGCNFSCTYCHNPETICLCRHCGGCVARCPAGALTLQGGRVHWQAAKCTGCGACHIHCPHRASPKVKRMCAEEVMAQVAQNLPFVRGITVSGGECTLHRDFLLALFSLAKARGLTALLDSNGSLPLAQDVALMAVCDGVMLDVKAVDEAFHRQLTGQGNAAVLQNARALAQMGKLQEVRTVILPGCAHNAHTIQGLARILGQYAKTVPYKLIRFRPLGVRGKAAGWPNPTEEEMQTLEALAHRCGFACTVAV